jgi:K(+)-stimulated pyrophosphate-energized sodium pump
VSAVLSTVAAFAFLPTSFDGFGVEGLSGDGSPAVIAVVAVLLGIVLAAVILSLTGYYTGTEHRPVKDVTKTALTGPATVILSGLSVGFESAVYTALVIGGAVFGAFLLGGASVTVSLPAASSE